MLGYLFYLKAVCERISVNQSSSASNPAGFRLADAKLEELAPSLYWTSPQGAFRCFCYDGLSLRYYIRDMLRHGDSRAAVVVSVDPLLVACYSDDLDGVCLLNFERRHITTHNLCVGSRLLTVLNAYAFPRPVDRSRRASDLVQGDMANPCYINFWPLVAEFLSDDFVEIHSRKMSISEEEYERCFTLGKFHLSKFGGRARSGSPVASMRPAPLKYFGT